MVSKDLSLNFMNDDISYFVFEIFDLTIIFYSFPDFFMLSIVLVWPWLDAW